MRYTIGTLFLAAIGVNFLLSNDAISASGPTHLCPFATILIPCVKQSQPENIANRWIRYRPIKWIPLWPNHAIWGGSHPDEDATDEPNATSYRWKEDEEDRATVPLTADNPKSIENIQIKALPLSIGFVDPWLVDRTEFTALAPVRNVFRGPELFDLWTKAVVLGTTCNNRDVRRDFRKPATITQDCAFARKIKNVRSGYLIEYCTYELARKVASEFECVEVAKDSRGRRSVHAARFLEYIDRPAVGGGEAEFVCELPGRQEELMAAAIIRWIRSYVGESSNFSWKSDDATDERPETYRKFSSIKGFTATGLNIYDPEELMFVRAYLRGSLHPLRDAMFSKHEAGVSLTLSWSFTVSAQSSDNVTNYREPNAAMGDRLSNQMEHRVKRFLHSLSSRTICRLVE
jgi:hypothetical protein